MARGLTRHGWPAGRGAEDAAAGASAGCPGFGFGFPRSLSPAAGRALGGFPLGGQMCRCASAVAAVTAGSREEAEWMADGFVGLD